MQIITLIKMFHIFSSQSEDDSALPDSQFTYGFESQDPEISLDEENEENEDLGVVDVEEGQRGKSGIGKVFIHRGIAFHAKTSKRKADGGRYLVCKTKGCGAKLMIAGDDRTVTKIYVSQASPVNTKNKTRPYQCHICQKTFARSDALKDHLNIHSGKFIILHTFIHVGIGSF